MSKPMHRAYELRGTPPNRYMHQTRRFAPGELQSFGFVQTDAQAWGVVNDEFHDRATLWRDQRGDELWVGEAYEGCETCGLPEYEHESGERRFAASVSIRGETPEVTNARMACEHFT